MSTRFPFKIEKAVEAIGVLMNRESLRDMNYMRLLKLLYLAERECYREANRPIIGDSLVAMERGPVLEQVYSLVRGQHFLSPEFSKFFQKIHYNLVMRDDPGIENLSEFEVEILHRVSDQHVDEDEWDLVRFTHERLTEWQKNDPGQSSRSIPLEDVLEAVGKTPEEIVRIVEDAQRRRAATGFLSEMTA